MILKSAKDVNNFSYFLYGSSLESDSFAALPSENSQGACQPIIKVGYNITDIMRKRLNRQFILQGIEIPSVVIKNVSLPEEIHSRMEEEIRTMIQTLHEERELD